MIKDHISNYKPKVISYKPETKVHDKIYSRLINRDLGSIGYRWGRIDTGRRRILVRTI